MAPAPDLSPTPRDRWRLAAIGACCTTLGSACLLLAACSTATVRKPTPSTALEPAPPPIATAAPAPLTTAPSISTTANAFESPWPRLRARYAMPGCDADPGVRKLARSTAASPVHLRAALQQAMPFLLIVTQQIEKFDMPGEFAFLPWVESSYTMIRGNTADVAGMWQLMPMTARELGLRIDSEYDGRLDVVASSSAALALLKQYEEEFGDWRLANMAFNAGENSVKGVLGARRGLSEDEIARVHLNQTTSEHLGKLRAMACIVATPERYHVSLPEPRAQDALVLLELPAPIDLRLAARLAHVDDALLQRWNPAYLRGRMPERGPYHLLVPAARSAAIEHTLGALPQYAWREWREMRLREAQRIDTLGMAYDIDTPALAAINHVEPDATLAAGTRLLLPGRSEIATLAAVEAVAVPAVATVDPALTVCTVRAGDTLWEIARRYRVRIEDLLQWNRLSRSSTLKLGQRLVLEAPASKGQLATD